MSLNLSLDSVLPNATWDRTYEVYAQTSLMYCSNPSSEITLLHCLRCGSNPYLLSREQGPSRVFSLFFPSIHPFSRIVLAVPRLLSDLVEGNILSIAAITNCSSFNGSMKLAMIVWDLFLYHKVDKENALDLGPGIVTSDTGSQHSFHLCATQQFYDPSAFSGWLRLDVQWLYCIRLWYYLWWEDLYNFGRTAQKIQALMATFSTKNNASRRPYLELYFDTPYNPYLSESFTEITNSSYIFSQRRYNYPSRSNYNTYWGPTAVIHYYHYY